jgi:hypothetical protein
MPMNEDQIEAGKCYSAGPEHYRVVSITRKIVTYQVWPKGGKFSPLRITCGLKAFAEAVRREIPCPDMS